MARRKPTNAEYIKAARRMYAVDGTCEIDDGTLVSRSDDGDGAYVKAWVWVYNDDIKEE